jgi:hypothetical protein
MSRHFTTTDLPAEPVTLASIMALLAEAGPLEWSTTAEPEPDSLAARLTAAGGTVDVGEETITITIPLNRPDLAAELAEAYPKATVTRHPKAAE